MSPSVSVVIPAFNAAHLLPRAIESVLRQTRPADEILVVNDGSTDNTLAVLARYAGQVHGITQENGGPARARNAAIAVATGEWIAFLDADDQWLPEKLERQLARAAAVPEAGVIFSDAIIMSREAGPVGRILDGKHPEQGWVLDALLRCFFVLPSASMARRALLVEAGLFAPHLRRVEDYDLWLRLARLCPFAMIPEALTLYERQPTSNTCNHLAEHEAHLRLFTELLESGLTPTQRRTVEARLERFRFGYAYELRKADPRAALRCSGGYLRSHLADPAAWKLVAGSLMQCLRAEPRTLSSAS